MDKIKNIINLDNIQIDFRNNSTYMNYCEENKLIPTFKGFRQWLNNKPIIIER